MKDIVLEMARRAKDFAPIIASAKAEVKNKILESILKKLIASSKEIADANVLDIKRSRKEGVPEALLDRLKLDKLRIKKIAESINAVIKLKDPVGEVIFGYNLPNGLILKNIRVPFGVIGVIYEARPDVTVDASVLCIKAGSCVLLRGSSHALSTNLKLVEVMRDALAENDFPSDIIQIIPTAGREDAERLMQLNKYVDLLIPRGGKSLINSVVKNSRVPVIETGVGNCHVYIDSKLDEIKLDLIIKLVVNSKTQRPSVCNAAEKLLVHRQAAEKVLPPVLDSLKKKNVLIKGCEYTRKIYPDAQPAIEDDWYEEYLDLKIAVKVVESLKDAVNHINKYGSHHTETIITSDYNNSIYFTSNVDSSTVFVNASTRFTDGGQFGMGAEIGISTQKLHWRGPLSIAQITTNKFIVMGDFQIRQ
ncbi:MAG: glutamate-5-semialdehyde dehydrogenase [Actinobacteria bacterium]|nr:glutamate-5-semialdehyde dehydrogenase [Actinomycetota bacterium]MBM3712318.1 glutamate-5-semialdehyde dehydrogenase [Actinomycetota bacterium]